MECIPRYLEEDGQTTVHFDGSGSFDPDHANETSSGIAFYEWRVLFDAPYGDDSFDLDGHRYSYSSDDDTSTNLLDFGHTASPT